MKTKYWAKCDCGWYCDTYKSSKEASDGLNKHLDENLYNDKCPGHGRYGASEYWE